MAPAPPVSSSLSKIKTLFAEKNLLLVQIDTGYSHNGPLLAGYDNCQLISVAIQVYIFGAALQMMRYFAKWEYKTPYPIENDTRQVNTIPHTNSPTNKSLAVLCSTTKTYTDRLIQVNDTN